MSVKSLSTVTIADKNFLKNIVPGVKTWVYGYDVKTKAQSSQLVSKTKVSSVQYEGDADWFVFCFFFGGIIQHGQAVNKEYYFEGDEKAERGSEEKKAWCEGGNNCCSIITMLWHIPPF